jgi:hypothetical protein
VKDERNESNMVKGTVKEFEIKIKKRNGKKLNVPLSAPIKHKVGVEVKLHSFLASTPPTAHSNRFQLFHDSVR